MIDIIVYSTITWLLLKSFFADEIVMRYYGCGSPIPDKIDGCTVLDLGCGTGRDVYVVSNLVGAGVANTVGFRRE